MKTFPILLKYVDAMRQTQAAGVNNDWSEGRHSFWGVDWDYKIPDPSYKTSWRVHVGKWKSYEDPNDYQARQHLAWSFDQIFQETEGKYIAEWAEERCQTASSTPQQRNLRGVDRWQRLLQGDCWRSSEAGIHCSRNCCAWRRMTAVGNLRQVQLQLMPERNSQIQETQELSEKWSDNKGITWPKGVMWEVVTVSWFTNQSLFKKLWRYQKPKPPWTKHEEIRDKSSVGFKEGEIKVRSRPSSEEGLKHSSPREFDWTSVTWRTPNLQNSPRNTTGELCYRGHNVKDKEGSRAVFAEQGASAFQIAAAKFWDTVSKLPGMAQELSDTVSALTQVKMTATPRLLRLPKEECPVIWIRITPRQRPKRWDTIDDPVVPLEQHLHGHPLAGLLVERKIWRSVIWKGTGKKYQHVNVFTCTKSSELFLAVFVKHSAKRNRPRRSSAIFGSSACCTHREAKGDHHAVQSKTELVQQVCNDKGRLTKKKTDKKKHSSRKRLLLGALTWRVMQKSALGDTWNRQRKMSLVFSRWQRHAWTITRYLWEIMKQPCSSVRYVLRYFWNACTWQEMDDQNYDGQ